MAMTERSRNALYEGLSDIIDEEAVGEMLSYFPARDVEEPATADLVRAECALLRADFQHQMAELRVDLQHQMAELRVDLQHQMGGMGADFQHQMAELRADLQGQMGGMGADLQGQMAALRTDGARQVDLRDLSLRVDQLAVELRTEIRSSARWTIGAMVSLMGVMIAAMAAFV